MVLDWIASSKRFVGFLSKPFPSTLILTNRSLNVVDFGNILKDPNNSFDGQDFTAPEDGYYYFETQVGFEKDQVDIPDLTGFVSLQNVNAAHYRLMINDRRVSVKVSGIAELTTGDVVRVVVLADSNPIVSVMLQSGGMYFNGYKIN